MPARRALITLLAATVLGCTLPSGARWPNDERVSPGDAPAPATSMPTDDLTLTLASEKERWVLGEPVHVVLTLTNRSSRPIRLAGNLDPSHGATHLVIGDRGRTRAFGPLSEVDADASMFVDLAPGASIGDAFPLFFGAGGWTFPAPGAYSVEAIYETPGDQGRRLRVRSSALPLTIEPTRDESGPFLLKGDGSREAGKFLLWQAGDHLDAGRQQLETLRQRWPDSILSDYAAFALGKSLSEPFSDYRKKAVRPRQCEPAMKLLAAADEAVLTRSARIQLHLARLRCELEASQWERAEASIARIHGITAGRVEYERVMERVREYEAYLARAR